MFCNIYNLRSLVVDFTTLDSSYWKTDSYGTVYKNAVVLYLRTIKPDGTSAPMTLSNTMIWFYYISPSEWKGYKTYTINNISSERCGEYSLLSSSDIDLFKLAFPNKIVPDFHYCNGAYTELFGSLTEIRDNEGNNYSFSYNNLHTSQNFRQFYDEMQYFLGMGSIYNQNFNANCCNLLLERNYFNDNSNPSSTLTSDKFTFYKFLPINDNNYPWTDNYLADTKALFDLGYWRNWGHGIIHYSIKRNAYSILSANMNSYGDGITWISIDLSYSINYYIKTDLGVYVLKSSSTYVNQSYSTSMPTIMNDFIARDDFYLRPNNQAMLESLVLPFLDESIMDFEFYGGKDLKFMGIFMEKLRPSIVSNSDLSSFTIDKVEWITPMPEWFKPLNNPYSNNK